MKAEINIQHSKLNIQNSLSSFLAFAFFILPLFSPAQSTISDLRVEFKINESAQSSVPEVLFRLNVSDTAAIQKVIITLGSTPGGTEFLSYSLNANGSSLPQGLTLQIVGNSILINTGSHSGVVHYYATAKLQYTNETFSAVKTTNNVE